MICTIQQDSMGSLHAWRGRVNPFRASAYLYTADGKEAQLFIQEGMGAEEALDYLSAHERSRLARGYSIQTRNLPEEYLPY